jgi:hypothetical protein
MKMTDRQSPIPHNGDVLLECEPIRGLKKTCR